MLASIDRGDIRFVKWIELNHIFSQIPFNTISDMSIYQMPQFLSITGKGRKFSRSSLWNLRGVTEDNIIQYCSGEVCAVCPLLINKRKKEVVLRGNYTSAGQLGIIYTQDWSYEAFCHLIETIKSRYQNLTIKFDRLREDTRLRSYLTKYCMDNHCGVHKSACVSVQISDGYDAWYGNLSKSTRQTIRTSYNRIKKANISMQVKFTRGGQTKESTTWKRVYLYSKRTLAKNSYSYNGILGRVVSIAEAVNKYADPMTKALNTMEDSFTAEVFFDAKLVAFLRGFVSQDKRMFIAHLTIDSEFGYYSPGGVLIHETIQYLSSKKDGLNVEELDFQEGDEPYKYRYGGTTYYNYTFTLS